MQYRSCFNLLLLLLYEVNRKCPLFPKSCCPGLTLAHSCMCQILECGGGAMCILECVYTYTCTHVHTHTSRSAGCSSTCIVVQPPHSQESSHCLPFPIPSSCSDGADSVYPPHIVGFYPLFFSLLSDLLSQTHREGGAWASAFYQLPGESS